MEIYGIVGYPLEHTLSPYIHNRAFKENNINAEYEIFKCKTAEDISNLLRKQKICGFNVTIPHKNNILHYLDKISDKVKYSGAVNAVKILDDGKIFGDNFDIDGFTESFSKSQQIKNGNFIILGCGGSARSIYYSLASNGAEKITISARNIKKAEDMHYYFEQYFPKVIKNVTSFGNISFEAEKCNGLINCTPCTMKGFEDTFKFTIPENINKNCFVFDLVYIPQNTKLMENAIYLGLNCKSGLEMLLIQALKSFEMWTGKIFDLKRMEHYLKCIL